MSDLSPQLRYHSVQPQSIKTAYSEFDNLDFLIACGPGRSLVQNSVRITGRSLHNFRRQHSYHWRSSF